MKIIELTAENFKRLKAVEITPAEHVQVIGGRNAQGKTSVLDAIWAALGGGAASKATARPIRDGEETAAVRLDLGDLVVSRTWKGDKSTLTVTAADGARYTSPQGILDSLVGRLSFDPLEFTRLSPREQVAALLDLVDLDVDLDALTSERSALYDQRTDIGRRGKALGDTPAPDADLPADEQSAADLIGQIREAQAAHRHHDETARAAERAQSERERAEAALKAAQAAEAAAIKAVKALPELPDLDGLETALTQVEDTNARVRENNDRRRHHEQKAALVKQYETLTAKIETLDAQRSKALAAAKFPIEGLGFGDEGVTYQGIPFSQASSAEQIRVSLAMAMALNPRLRVIRILDGSLLDAENLALISEMARDADYQVLIERVGNADEGAVIIEDGEVAS